MSVTYGFYNSYNGDRRYNAEQFSSIFDGVIEDGVYQSIRKDANTAPFAVTPNGALSVNVDVGRAWLKHTWTYNDANVAVDLAAGDDVYDRTDAIVIDVDLFNRENKIIAVAGDITRSDRKPMLTWDTTSDHYQYLLAYITRPRASTNVTQDQITPLIAASLDSTDPNRASKLAWVTAPVQSFDISTYYSNWAAAWEEWWNAKIGDGSSGEYPTAWRTWSASQQSAFEQWLRNANASIPSSTAADLITRLEATENMISHITSDGGYTFEEALEDAGGVDLYDSTGAVLNGRIVYIMAGLE